MPRLFYPPLAEPGVYVKPKGIQLSPGMFVSRTRRGPGLLVREQTVQERHDLGPVAAGVGTKLGGAQAVGDAVLHSPQDGGGVPERIPSGIRSFY